MASLLLVMVSTFPINGNVLMRRLVQAPPLLISLMLESSPDSWTTILSGCSQASIQSLGSKLEQGQREL